MKIAHLLPRSITFPLKSHNGRHEWVLNLAKIQAKNGHDVTIYCNPESQTNLANVQMTGVSGDFADKDCANTANFELALSRDYDIFHSHFDYLHYKLAHKTNKSIVFTQHWPPSDELARLAKKTSAENVWGVPPTEYMYKIDREIGVQSKGFIPHGIDLNFFKRGSSNKNGRLLFVSRIAPEKRVEQAIAAAKQSGIGLDIIGKTTDKYQSYWNEVRTDIDGEFITYLGAKSQTELIKYYSEALAVIFPSKPDEPFGLVAIEAQACETPIIMQRGGSRGELVIDKKTGFLCETTDDYADAIRQSADISPLACRLFAEQFDVNKMAAKYDLLYDSLIRQRS